MNYQKYTLNELVTMAKKGDKNAAIKIIKKFIPYIYKMVGSLYIKDMDEDDLKQMGYVSVIKAIKSFNINKTKNFTSYVTTAIKNNYYYEIRKKVKERYNISLQTQVVEELTLMDVIKDDTELEKFYIQQEQIKMLRSIVVYLSTNQKQLLRCFYKNNKGDLSKYAKNNGISVRAVYKRKTVLFKKLRKLLNF